jgi:hypothetical protein
MTKIEKIGWLIFFIIIIELAPKEENLLNAPPSKSLENRDLSQHLKIKTLPSEENRVAKVTAIA